MIRSTILFMILATAIVCPLAADTYDERTLVWVAIANQANREFILSSRIDVTDAGRDWVKALLRKEEFQLLEEHGLTPEILHQEMERDRALWREADAAAELLAPTYYYTASKFNTTNPGSNTLMKHLLDLYNAHPDIARLYDIGDSYGGTYDILAIKVTKNPNTVESEPKIRIYGNIHGDEKGGLMVVCEALDWILANYPADPSARKLVDESEMWFIPMGNPNGNAANSRYNGNSVDLNRNFWGPAGSSDGSGDFSEPETQAIRDLTVVMGKRFTNSLSFHGGAACFNSLWNYTYDRPTDEPIFWSTRTPGDGCSSENGCLTLAPHGLAKAYQDGCTTAGFWYTNGADWYQTYGDTNDWSYGQWSDLDTTLEVTVTKTPAASTIPTYVAEHRQATINYMLKTFQNISGIMTDQATGAPLDGTVAATCTASSTIPVPHAYQAIYTDPVAGDFHRVLQPGTYTVECMAPGYQTMVVAGVAVAADSTTTVNCALTGIVQLVASSVTLTDQCAGAGAGGDGTLDPGETAVLAVSLHNAGAWGATSVQAVLASAATGVVITRGTASYPAIGGGATQSSLAPHYLIAVDPSVPCGTVLPFTLDIASAQGHFSDAFSLTVGQLTPTGGTLLTETFDGTAWPPADWGQTNTSGTAGNWARATATVHPSGSAPSSGAGLAYFNSYNAPDGNSTRLYRTAGVAVPGSAAGASVAFSMYHDTGFASDDDRVQVQVSTNGGSGWSDVAGGLMHRNDGSTGWATHTVALPGSIIGQNDVRLGFNGISAYGNDCHLDEVRLEWAGAPSCASIQCLAPPAEVSAPGSPRPLLFAKDAACASGYCLSFEKAAGAVGYNAYEGILGTWYSHSGAAGNLCDAAAMDLGNGRMRIPLNPGSGNRYYLVTAFNAVAEGTAGGSGADAQRSCAP